MPIHVQKSNKGGFLGVGLDATNTAVYITPDSASATKYFAMQKPVVVSASIADSSGLSNTNRLPVWQNLTGVTMVVKTLKARISVKNTTACTLKLVKVASGVALNSGGATEISSVGSRIDLGVSTTVDTDTDGTIVTANAEVADGSWLVADLAVDTLTDLAGLALSVALEPKVTAVTFPNV